MAETLWQVFVGLWALNSLVLVVALVVVAVYGLVTKKWQPAKWVGLATLRPCCPVIFAGCGVFGSKGSKGYDPSYRTLRGRPRRARR